MYASTKSVSSAKNLRGVASTRPPPRHRGEDEEQRTPHANDRLKPWTDLEDSTRSMGSKVGIAAMPFAMRSQCKGLNVDETVGRFVWKPKITRRPVCARASYDRRNVATCGN